MYTICGKGTRICYTRIYHSAAARVCLETRRAAEMSDATPHLAIAGACSNRSACNKFNNYRRIIRREDKFNSEKAFPRIHSRSNVARDVIILCRSVLRCIVRVRQTNVKIMYFCGTRSNRVNLTKKLLSTCEIANNFPSVLKVL